MHMKCLNLSSGMRVHMRGAKECRGIHQIWTFIQTIDLWPGKKSGSCGKGKKHCFSLVIRGLMSDTPAGVIAEFGEVTSAVMGPRVTN